MEKDESKPSPMERFEDLGRKLFQVPKEPVEADAEPEEPCEEPTEDDEPGEADS